ncbi:gamma-secretase-activating protein isoform X7 [Hyaena hyaena]|uniref:gamma-secretase-activating protein isoform X7 n=1 Tax=Hyaena hyaena TaxID=95912 RepID=UPI001924F346|nr:gamma-secretase-activating protein isoform X7 [Hyaena hyaena]
MALRLVSDFDLRKDVLPWLRAQRAAPAAAGARGGGPGVLENNYESLRILNVERNGNIIYTYKDNEGNVFFGLYDCQTRQNEHLYTFEKDLHVVSCSVNSERTLLAVSLVHSTKEGRKNELQPGSKCLTLLVEIHPVNNVKVLKAVDSYIWVQFLYPHVESHPLPENHLLLISEEKYIEKFHIQVIQEDGNRAVIKDSGHLPRERVAEEFVWAQWDMSEQRLYYIDLKKSRSILKCIQFSADEKFNLMFEAPLDITLSDSGFKLVNFGCDDLQDPENLSKHLTLCVFTNHTASSYWSICPETSNMDKLLPHSSVLIWNTEIPGITLATEEIALPFMKVHSFKGYWEKLNSNLEYVKYSKPHLHYNNSMVRKEWHNLISEEKTGRRRSMVYVRNILDNATKVISNLEARNFEPRLTPLFQEEDHNQRLLIGLMVSELKDHLLRHLQGVEKKKIEQMVLDYVSKLLDLICQILETSWRKHNLHPCVLRFSGRASAAEFTVFYIMTRILEATRSLFLPLPPGFHTLHTILGVHCLPLHNLLHYIDSGVLLLTETAVTRLMKDLDNTEKNERLKFSIIVRLPPLIGQKICRLWDHPMSSNIISRNHVKRLLQNYKKKPPSSMIDKSSFSVDFLPLNYFIEILTDIESSNQALYAFEGHDNVDAKFVEEAALKHTMMLLGL